MRVGFLTVKTGPLASGGLQMEQGLALYLKERNNMLAGRPVQLFTGDSAGAPAVARTKMQELVERDNVSCLIGPLATAEALAIDDYIRDKQVPTLSVAAAEDMTQRKANPWFVRATSSSAQCSYAMGDYAAKELKYKRAAMIADDIAYGYELNAGFQRAFEDAGGKVVQKLWPPLNAPDYGTYIAQLKRNVDAVFIGFAGSNGLKFLRQYKEYGGTTPLLGGMTAIDESLLRQMGDEAIGTLSTCWYSAQLDNPSNKRLVPGMQREHRVDPGFYAAATYTNAAVLEAALKTIDGKIEDKTALMKALRGIKVEDTCRGPVSFDKYGNVVGNVYIRKVEKKGGNLVNTVIKTYPNVSQFWTYDPDEFLKSPVYNRDGYPANRFLEP
jgi:branched-chain amino acid transport system substrate-binding protein